MRSAWSAVALVLACAAAAGCGASALLPPRLVPAPLPPPQPGHMRLTALGTGVPRVMRSQYATSYLLQLGDGEGSSFLFDIGDGALINLIQVAPGTWGRAQLFLTHLHSDHIADAVQLLALGQMLGGRGDSPLHVWGPSGPDGATGTAGFVEGLNRMLAWDRAARERVKRPQRRGGAAAAASAGAVGDMESGGGGGGEQGDDTEPLEPPPPPPGALAVAHEFDCATERHLVFDRSGVKIFASPADHYFTRGPVAYRLEWRGLSLVIGGDGARAPALEALSKGADVLVLDAMATPPGLAEGLLGGGGGASSSEAAGDHTCSGGGGSSGGSGGSGSSRDGLGDEEAAAAAAAAGPAASSATPLERRNIAASHATPAQAGEMFAAAGPRLAIATHISANGWAHTHAVTEVRRAYAGPLAIAQDLDFWDVGPNAIEAGHLFTAHSSWGLTFGQGTGIA